MLRRPPTVLTLTSEDLKAYEDRRDAVLATKQQAHRHHHQTPLAEHVSRSTSSSGYEDVSDSTLHRHHHQPGAENYRGEEEEEEEEEAEDEEEEEEEDSYYPRRYRTIENPDEDAGPEIFLNEVDAAGLPYDPFTSSSSGGSSASNHHHHLLLHSTSSNSNVVEEDQVMAELAPEDLPEARAARGESIFTSSGGDSARPPPVSRFGRRTLAAAAVTPTAAGRGGGGGGAMGTPEAPVRQTRSREERILGRGARR